MTQNEQVLKHLKRHGRITPLQALKRYGCMRLGARIYSLKQQGHDIRTRMVQQNGKHFAEYTLAVEDIAI